MAMNTANVTTGKRRVDGGIYRAPIGTTLPTDASTSLAAAFKNIGYVAEDGVTNAISRDTKDIKEWGGDTVDSVLIGQNDTFKFKSIEALNVDLLKTVFGDSNVSESSGAITINVKATESENAVYVIDMVMKNNRLKRIVIPSGKITTIGDIVYKADEAVAYELTITATLDSNGNTHYEYISAVPSTST